LTKNPSIKTIDEKELRKNLSKISWDISGKVSDVIGSVVEANLPQSQLGMICEIFSNKKESGILSEVVGFKEDKALLLAFSSLSGLTPGAIVKKKHMHDTILVGDHLLGNVIDAFGQSLDLNSEMIPSGSSIYVPLEKPPPNPMNRERIKKPISLGIKSIDSLLTIGEGQRIGIFAGSGVGKSVLMGMIAKGSTADCNVIGLIGERGREVREFIDKDLGPEGLKRSVVVVVTSDQSPLMKLRGAKLVASISEYFSSLGKNVLLMMDSLTRVAQAQREIGLSVGELPTAKGYPPSVYSLLPKLLERSGPQPKNFGPISGIYTVLVDGDDFHDPIPDNARAILDGHIYLSRSLATKGHFPSIDVPSSISRVMNDIVSDHHKKLAVYMKSLISVYQENLDYIQLGTYVKGSNILLDKAISLMPQIEAFLKQDMKEHFSMDKSMEELIRIIHFEEKL
jgi:flagellum-specific ATP synthase